MHAAFFDTFTYTHPHTLELYRKPAAAVLCEWLPSFYEHYLSLDAKPDIFLQIILYLDYCHQSDRAYY